MFEDGVFFIMNKLYGVCFKFCLDLLVYYFDVKVYELFDVNGDSLVIFYVDYFFCKGKCGGVWMSLFVG